MSQADEPDVQNVYYWRGRAIQAEARAGQLAQDLEMERMAVNHWRNKVRELEARVERGRGNGNGIVDEQQAQHQAAVVREQKTVRHAGGG